MLRKQTKWLSGVKGQFLEVKREQEDVQHEDIWPAVLLVPFWRLVMKFGHKCKMIHQDWSNTPTSSTLIPDTWPDVGERIAPVIFYSSSAQKQIHVYWWSDRIHMRRVDRTWQAHRGETCVRSSAGAALTRFLKEDLVVLIMSTNGFRIRTRLHLQVYAWERDSFHRFSTRLTNGFDVHLSKCACGRAGLDEYQRQ